MTKYKKEAQEGAKTNEEVHCILIRWVKLVICLQSGLVQGHILSIFSLLVEDLALCLFLSPTHTHTHANYHMPKEICIMSKRKPAAQFISVYIETILNTKEQTNIIIDKVLEL